MSAKSTILRSLLISGSSLLSFCFVWEIIASTNLIPNFPGALQTFKELLWWLSDPFFDNGPNDLGIGFNLLISLRRVLIGYTLAMIVAIPVGLFVGVSKTVKSSVDPYVQLLKPVSPLAWLPIGLFVFRNSEVTGIFVIFITSIWPTLINTAIGVQTVDSDVLKVAKSLGASRTNTITKVILPAVMPNILAGMRISMGTAWLVIVAAEMLLGTGIGYFIWNEWNNLYVANIFVAIIIIGITGYILDQIFEILQLQFNYDS